MDDSLCSYYSQYTKPEDSYDKGNLSKFMAEDYLTSRGVMNLGYKVNHDYYCDFNYKERNNWFSIISSLFIIVPMNKVGLRNQNYTNISDFHFYKSMSFIKWKKICGHKISKLDIFFDQIHYIIRIIMYRIWCIYNHILRDI